MSEKHNVHIDLNVLLTICLCMYIGVIFCLGMHVDETSLV